MNRRAILKAIKRHMPVTIRRSIQWLRYGGAELPYLETHLTDHCNLRCKSCGHFSSISPPIYACLEEFKKDLARISEIFSRVAKYRLMGGEPLLHPEVEMFVRTARELLSDCDIRLVTNGILLPKMGDKFWKTMSDMRVSLDVSLYPVNIDIEAIKAISLRYGVMLHESTIKNEFFMAPINVQGTSNLIQSFEACRRLCKCPYLSNGHIYTCARIALAPILGRRIGVEFPIHEKDSINIYNNVTGHEILDYLRHPVQWCRYCDFKSLRYFPWEQSSGSVTEWL